MCLHFIHQLLDLLLSIDIVFDIYKPTNFFIKKHLASCTLHARRARKRATREFLLSFNSRSESRCIKWRHMKFFYCLISWGRSRGVENINMKFCWDASQLIWAQLRQKTEKNQKLPKVVGFIPSMNLCNSKLSMWSICCEISLFINQVPKTHLLCPWSPHHPHENVWIASVQSLY